MTKSEKRKLRRMGIKYQNAQYPRKVPLAEAIRAAQKSSDER